MSKYLISIVRRDGDPVLLRPGGLGERDLRVHLLNKIALRNFKQKVLDAVKAKGVGLGRSTAHVLDDVAAAIDEANLIDDVAKSLDEVIIELKSEVQPV